MKQFYYFLILIGFVFSLVRNGYSQDISSEILSLENELRNFNYQQVLKKGQFLLLETDISKKDSLKIYEYILNAAYSMNDTIAAKHVAEEALHCSPDFVLDPRITSPKIINFFMAIKKSFVNSEKIEKPQPKNKPDLRFEPVPTKYFLSSLLYPGSSHLFKGYKKGYYFTGISSILLGSIVYSSIKVTDARDKYMQAKANVDFDKLYADYNFVYKIRNGLILSYLVFNLYTLYDFYSSEINDQELSIDLIKNQHSVAVQFSYSW